MSEAERADLALSRRSTRTRWRLSLWFAVVPMTAKLAGLAIALGSLTGVTWLLAIRPASDRIHTMEQDLPRLRGAAQRAHRLEALQRRLAQRLPTLGHEHPNDLMDVLRGLPLPANLKVDAIEPGIEVPYDGIVLIPIRVEISGGFARVVEFLGQVSGLPWRVWPQSMTLISDPSAAGERPTKATLVLTARRFLGELDRQPTRPPRTIDDIALADAIAVEWMPVPQEQQRQGRLLMPELGGSIDLPAASWRWEAEIGRPESFRAFEPTTSLAFYLCHFERGGGVADDPAIAAVAASIAKSTAGEASTSLEPLAPAMGHPHYRLKMDFARVRDRKRATAYFVVTEKHVVAMICIDCGLTEPTEFERFRNSLRLGSSTSAR